MLIGCGPSDPDLMYLVVSITKRFNTLLILNAGINNWCNLLRVEQLLHISHGGDNRRCTYVVLMKKSK